MTPTRTDRIVTHTFLLAFCVLALLPFMSMALVSVYPHGQEPSGFSLPHGVDLGNYAGAWREARLGTLMRSSIIISVCVVPAATFLSILAGYAFGTMQFRGKNVLFYLFLIGLAMPFEATVVPLYYDERILGLTDSYVGLILPETALFLSFGTFWMRSFFWSASSALMDAARLDGANSWQVLWRVLLPAGGRPAVTTLMTLFFMWSWNEFLLALVLLQDPDRQTAPAGVAFFIGEFDVDESHIAAAGLIVTVPVILVYLALQRHFIRGMLAGSMKG